MGSKCGTRTRASEREREKRSSRAHAEANEASERYAKSGARISPFLPPRTSSSPLLLFGLLVSLFLSSPFSVSVPHRPLFYGNGLTLSLSPSHSRGEEPSIQFYLQPLGRPFRPREQKLIISTKRYTPLTGCIPLVKNGNPRERRRGFRFLCSRRQFPSRLTN